MCNIPKLSICSINMKCMKTKMDVPGLCICGDCHYYSYSLKSVEK